jgi:primosomal protein N' (replication factor Y)
MYQQQIAERKSFNYPPFVRLIKIVVKHTNAKTVVSAANYLVDLLRKSIPDQILGPEYPMVSMINNYHLNEIYIKIDMNSGLAEKKVRIGKLIDQVNHHLSYKGVRFSVDVDPQ